MDQVHVEQNKTEATAGRYFPDKLIYKGAILKILQIFQENVCGRAFFQEVSSLQAFTQKGFLQKSTSQ